MTTIARGSAVDVQARAMTEDQLQAAVVGMADALGVLAWHDTDSRRNRPGLPDLVLVGRRVAFIELKRQGGRVSPEQHRWLTALARAEGVSAAVWRPMQLLDGTVERVLRDLSPNPTHHRRLQ